MIGQMLYMPLCDWSIVPIVNEMGVILNPPLVLQPASRFTGLQYSTSNVLNLLTVEPNYYQICVKPQSRTKRGMMS